MTLDSNVREAIKEYLEQLQKSKEQLTRRVATNRQYNYNKSKIEQAK